MKLIFIVIFSPILLFSQQDFVVEINPYFTPDSINYIDVLGNKQGIWVKEFKNGSIEEFTNVNGNKIFFDCRILVVLLTYLLPKSYLTILLINIFEVNLPKAI